MVTEQKTTKKNTDYTASAFFEAKNEPGIQNPQEVINLYLLRERQQQEAEALNKQIEACVPLELLMQHKAALETLAATENELRTAIQIFGNYQDVEQGRYALRQKRETKQYSAENFETCFPEYATAVLTKSVNVAVLDGLIKGGLLNEEGLKRANILTTKSTFAFIIK